MSNITTDLIKKIIKERFGTKKFTTGDVYYAIETNFNLRKFGIIRNSLVKLSKEGFISYKIELRGTPHFDSQKKEHGAVYFFNE